MNFDSFARKIGVQKFPLLSFAQNLRLTIFLNRPGENNEEKIS